MSNSLGFIPASVRYDTITNTTKLLYCEITANLNEDGCCELSDIELSKLMGYEPKSISRMLRFLENKKHIKRISKESKRYIFPKLDGRFTIKKKIEKTTEKTRNEAQELLSSWNEWYKTKIPYQDEYGVHLKEALNQFTLEEIKGAAKNRYSNLITDPWWRKKRDILVNFGKFISDSQTIAKWIPPGDQLSGVDLKTDTVAFDNDWT